MPKEQKLTKSLAKQITLDWHRHFPEFEIFRPMWLMKRNGPVLVGLCLDRFLGSTHYRPTLHIHNLCRSTGFLTLTLLTRARRANRSEIAIPLKSHALMLNDTAATLRASAALTLSDPLALTDLLKAYHYDWAHNAANKYPVLEFEEIVSVLIFCGRTAQARQCIKEFEQTMNAWPEWVLGRDNGVGCIIDKLNSIIEKPSEIAVNVTTEVEILGVGQLADRGFIC